MADAGDEPLLPLPDRASSRRRVAALLAGLLGGIAVAVAGLEAFSRWAARPPVWPSAYQVSYNISYPSTLSTQRKMLVYTLVAYRDESKGLQKIVRDGVETTLEVLANRTMYRRYPRVDAYACDAVAIGGDDGPTTSAAAKTPPRQGVLPHRHLDHVLHDDDVTLNPVLPDMTAGGWRRAPTARRADGRAGPAGATAYERVFVAAGDPAYGAYDSRFTLWVSAAGAPVLLEALAVNMWTGGHYDLTVAQFGEWRPGPPPASRFKVPKGCPTTVTRHARTLAHVPTVDLLAAALPNRHAGDAAYDAFVHARPQHPSPRRTRTWREYAARAAAHADAVRRVAAHNAQGGHSYRLAVTHMADVLPHEKAALVSQHPRADGAPAVPRPTAGDAFYEPPAVPRLLPSTVDWRGTPADSPPKDQAMCGSCWAFGTVGALEAAHYRATGKRTLFSEQHLLDCAWSPTDYRGDFPNAGCDGGYQTTALDWLLSRGGAVGEDAYPYRGVNGFCDTSVPDAASFTGRYVWVRGGAAGLRAALLAKGPMTVSVDAGPDDFALYREGIYNNTKCETKLKRLDHAVLISGYGTDAATGQDYWIVKNTWGTRWGEGGYIRIAVHPDDCGIEAQPLYVDLKEKA